jgi:hypothetical protein
MTYKCDHRGKLSFGTGIHWCGGCGTLFNDTGGVYMTPGIILKEQVNNAELSPKPGLSQKKQLKWGKIRSDTLTSSDMEAIRRGLDNLASMNPEGFDIEIECKTKATIAYIKDTFNVIVEHVGENCYAIYQTQEDRVKRERAVR